MQQLPSKLHQPGLVLLIGLAGGLVPGVSQASASVETNLTANIVNATCQVSVENNGEIYLPTIMRGWFYNSDNSNRLTPNDDEAGTPFTIQVVNCYESETSGAGVKQLQFSFSPKNGFWSNQYQVFKNDATTGAAENVGIVIFSSKNRTNVLNTDGSSNVSYDVSSGDEYLKDYQFYARYQNIGAVTGGIVTSNVLVDVHYE
ncbi:fimbrial-like protein [Enterobacter sp.]|uniref:fimbrial-like protein n=1 Tax=Enterobacter sp. TaxID=42895 RepID=UPI0039E5EC30